VVNKLRKKIQKLLTPYEIAVEMMAIILMVALLTISVLVELFL